MSPLLDLGTISPLRPDPTVSNLSYFHKLPLVHKAPESRLSFPPHELILSGGYSLSTPTASLLRSPRTLTEHTAIQTLTALPPC